VRGASGDPGAGVPVGDSRLARGSGAGAWLARGWGTGGCGDAFMPSTVPVRGWRTNGATTPERPGG